MAKKLTPQEVMQRVKERKALAEAKIRAEERKAALLERNRRRPARKPLVERKAPADRPAIVETRTRRTPAARPETLNENIAKRNKALNLNPAQEAMYTQLALNTAKLTESYVKQGLMSRGILNEATQAGPGVTGVTNNQAGVGLVQTFFDIFYGFFPDLITPLIASVQPMKTEQGHIFYMQYTAGSNKGQVVKDEVLIDPFVVNTNEDFTSNRVVLADDVQTAGAHSLTKDLWAPVKPKGVVIEGADLVWATDTTFTGTLNGVAITAGTVTETATDVTVDFTLGGALDKPVKVFYTYDNVFSPTQVPELTANVKNMPIRAEYRTIKTNYSFQAGWGFEAEQGGDLGAKLAEAAMFELKREIDLQAIGKIFNDAPVKVRWNKNAGFAVGGYNDHKLTFVDAVVRAANTIFERSQRVAGNILIVGMDALNVVQTLPMFKGTELGNQHAGARMVGKLQEMPVIVVPEIANNLWAVIYKGAKDNLDAGLVFAPYIPVFATDPVTLDDLQIRRAYITAYALKTVNANYFVAGEIINEPTALPIYIVSKDGTDTGLGEIGVDAGLDIFG